MKNLSKVFLVVLMFTMIVYAIFLLFKNDWVMPLPETCAQKLSNFYSNRSYRSIPTGPSRTFPEECR